MKLAKNLRLYCLREGISLSQLSKKSGIPLQTLHGWSTGRHTAKLEHLKKAAATLQVSIYELAFGENDPFSQKKQELPQFNEIFSGDVRITIHHVKKNSDRSTDPKS